jgi:hypothetical protein
MVVIVQCVIWGNAFKFVYVETMNEYRHKMKRDSSQTIFGFLLKDMEFAFKLKRYIFKFHLSKFQFAMHLKFCIIYSWRSCVLFGFELSYRVLLRLPRVVFVVHVVSMTIKRKLLQLVAKSTSKSKPTLF